MLLRRGKRITLVVLVAAVVIVAGGTTIEYGHTQLQLKRKAEALTGGSVDRGERAFLAYGCNSCHTASGVHPADAKVGPPLTGIAGRVIIAGRLSNTPDNLVHWIEDPQAISPGTAMPRLGVTPTDARDIAAFLYTQS